MMIISKSRLYFASEIHLTAAGFISLYSLSKTLVLKTDAIEWTFGIRIQDCTKINSSLHQLHLFIHLDQISVLECSFSKSLEVKNTLTETRLLSLSSDGQHRNTWGDNASSLLKLFIFGISSVEVTDTICTEGLAMATVKWEVCENPCPEKLPILFTSKAKDP